MAPAERLSNTTPQDGAEEPPGVLGAVVRAAGSPAPVRIPPDGHVVVTTLEAARTVLTAPEDFVLPYDVSRQPVRRHGREAKDTPPLAPEAVAVGAAVFAEELAHTAVPVESTEIDTLVLLRDPVARSTTAAMLPALGIADRDRIAGLVLAWVDSLGPVISAARPPRRWSAHRRAEHSARRRLIGALQEVGSAEAPALATALAAGVQVPIASGAWCLTQLAARPDLHRLIREDPELAVPFVWEVLRLFPPTWVLPRIAVADSVLQGTEVPAYTPVLVSPLALGLLPRLVPGPDAGSSPLGELDPLRWIGTDRRPGAWLPFGAGPHACPGRNLGLAQLARLVEWSADLALHVDHPPTVNADRGLSPRPSLVRAHRRRHAG